MKIFVKNWSSLTVSNIIQQGSLFIFYILAARLLEPFEYGKFTLIITAVTIAQVLGSLGLQKIVIREVARNSKLIPIISRKIIYPLSVVYLVTCIALLYYLIVIVEVNDNITLTLVVLYLVAFLLWNFAEPFAFGLQEMYPVAFLNALSTVFLPLAVIVLPHSTLDFNSLLLIFVLVHFLKSFGLVFWEYYRKYFVVSNQVENEIVSFRYLVKKSMPIYATSILTIPVVYLPVLFLGLFNSMEQVGYWGISSKISLIFTLVTNNLFTAVFPIIAYHAKENTNVLKLRITSIIVLLVPLTISISLIISLFSYEAIYYILGMQYIDATPVLALQSWISLNIILHSMIGTFFIAVDSEKTLAKLSFMTAVVIGLANYFGSFYSAEILAIFALIAYLFTTIVHWTLLISKIKIEWRVLKNLGLLIIVLLLSTMTYLLSYHSLVIRFFIFFGVTITLFIIIYLMFKSEIQSSLKEIRKYVR